MLVAAFDIRDVFVFGGLALLWYGLHLLAPWAAFTVVGIVLLLLGLGITSVIGKVRNGAPGRT